MFQGSMFRPSSGQGFMPQVRVGGFERIQSQRVQGFYPTVSLGQDTQTAHAWFERAKKAIERYETLKARAGTINNKATRDSILTGLGSTEVVGSPEYRYTRAKEDFTTGAVNEGVGAYNVEARQKRVSELEQYNDQFGAKVEEAVQVYGTEPVSSFDGSSDLTVPILIGAGAITLALLFG